MKKSFFIKNKLDKILENLNVKQKRLNKIAREKGVSNWLNTYLLKEYGYNFNKQHFWDGISIRYDWLLSYSPTCACGLKYERKISFNTSQRYTLLNCKHIERSMP